MTGVGEEMGRSSRLMDEAAADALRITEELAGRLRGLGAPSSSSSTTKQSPETSASKTGRPELRTSSLSQLQSLLPARSNWEDSLLPDPEAPVASPSLIFGGPREERTTKTTAVAAVAAAKTTSRASSSAGWPVGSRSAESCCSGPRSEGAPWAVGSAGSVVGATSSGLLPVGAGSGEEAGGTASSGGAFLLRLPASSEPSAVAAQLRLPPNARLFINGRPFHL